MANILESVATSPEPAAAVRTHHRHFHSFDALRFFAFLKVFLYHIPSVGFGWLAYLMAGGTLAVRFFFVLSGFLITYIVLEEKAARGRINFKYFMLRRVLRIWPLYYLIVAFAFCTPLILSALSITDSPGGYQPNFIYTALFLENYVAIVKHGAANVSPIGVIWSICVEEHFYIVWGLALCYLPLRSMSKLIAGSVALALASRVVFVTHGYGTLDLLTNLDLFAIGALPAYLLIAHREQFEQWLLAVPDWLKRWVPVVAVGAVFIDPHLHGQLHDVIAPTLLGLLFGGLLSSFLCPSETLKISDGNVCTRLGKYTYGLYLFHVIVINALAAIFARAHWQSQHLPQGVPFMLLALGLSIAISVVSYRVFERPFLTLKRYA